MRAQRTILIGFLGLVVVACVASQSDEVGTPRNPRVASVLQGPRVLDWSSTRVPGRSTRGVPEDEIAAVQQPYWSSSPSTLVTTGAPVTASAAKFGASFSSPSATDVLFFGVNGSGGSAGINGGVFTAGGASTTSPSNNVFALTNLYGLTGSPVLAWGASIPGGVDRSAIALTVDGSKIYVVDTTGVLHCLLAATGANCSTSGGGWSDFSSGCGGGAHGSSPWVNYATGDIYFGDMCGVVHHLNGVTGADRWASFKPGPSATYQAAFQSSPVVLNGFVYIGDDEGQLFRITDTSSGNPTTVAIFDVCTAIGQSAPCPNGPNASPAGSGAAPWAVRAPLGFDVGNNHVYAVANDYVFELNGTSGNWSQTASSPKHLLSGVDGTTNGPMQSAALLDHTNKFVYTAINSKLFKVAYPFGGSTTANVWSTPLANGTGASNPVANAIVYNGTTYIGDTAGYAERFSCLTQGGAPQVDGETPNLGTSISGSGVLDYSTGNINFGVTTASGGGLLQYPLAVGSYSCPAGQKLCSPSNGPSNVCTAPNGTTHYGDACRTCCLDTDCSPGSNCVSGACVVGCTGGPGVQGSCTSRANSSVVCSAASGGTCTYTCNGGFANCDNTIATNGCPQATSTDVNNCGGCGNTCSNANIPIPACTAGVCNGHCADGFVDCDGNRLTNGCEAAAACGTAACCGTTCATGSVCYDNGGVGTCVSGQTTEVYGSNSQNNTVAIACPSGQLITGITFADYGAPAGVGGQSWSTTSACANAVTAGACTAPGCRWNGAACVATGCWTLTTSTVCGATSGCSWVAATGTCTTSACTALTTQSTCAGNSSCTWNTSLGLCTAYFGFLHDYGTSPNNKYPPNCALDVSGDTVVTNACLFNVSSCSFTASNDLFGTGTNPSSGASLPLATTPPNPSGYPQDPCPSITKRLYVEATCGFCENICTNGQTGTPCGSGITCQNGRCPTPGCAPDCATGTGCNVDSDCSSGTCTGGVCQAAACSPTCPNGAACGSNTDCGSGSCQNGQCAVPNCTPHCADGQPCGVNGDCGSGVCSGSPLVCQPASCAPTCLNGAACGQNSDCGSLKCTNGSCATPNCAPNCTTGQACGATSDCNSGVCSGSPSKCQAASCSPTCADGAACGAASECASGICNNGRCSPPACATICPDGNVCGANSDCASDVCTASVCAAPACKPTCALGAFCGANVDCASGICTNGKCESGAGGCAGTGTCGFHAGCTLNTDCLSGVCTAGKCAVPACSPTCADGAACGANSDCASNVCTNGRCDVPGCSPICNAGAACAQNSDCASGVCSGTTFTCQAPSCSPSCADGALCGNNADCGSNNCNQGTCKAPGCAPNCSDGSSCGSNADCGSLVCTSGTCQIPACKPNCSDGAYCGNNADCGSNNCNAGVCKPPACSPGCNTGQNCGSNADCSSNLCTSGSCVVPACSPICSNGSVCGKNADCGSGRCHNGLCKPAGCAPDCSNGTGCGADSDCGSDSCSGGTCHAPTCSPNCAHNSPCGSNADCTSNHCTSGFCQ